MIRAPDAGHALVFINSKARFAAGKAVALRESGGVASRTDNAWKSILKWQNGIITNVSSGFRPVRWFVPGS
jgi:hypothetical protein